jgi:hypothetical protein
LDQGKLDGVDLTGDRQERDLCAFAKRISSP